MLLEEKANSLNELMWEVVKKYDSKQERVEVIRKYVLEFIKPICEAFEITDYDYVYNPVREVRALRLNDTYIPLDIGGFNGIVDKILEYIIVKRDVYLTYYHKSMINNLKSCWLNEEQIKEWFGIEENDL